jgi:hypothetical protein
MWFYCNLRASTSSQQETSVFPEASVLYPRITQKNVIHVLYYCTQIYNSHICRVPATKFHSCFSRLGGRSCRLNPTPITAYTYPNWAASYSVKLKRQSCQNPLQRSKTKSKSKWELVHAFEKVTEETETSQRELMTRDPSEIDVLRICKQVPLPRECCEKQHDLIITTRMDLRRCRWME